MFYHRVKAIFQNNGPDEKYRTVATNNAAVRKQI